MEKTIRQTHPVRVVMRRDGCIFLGSVAPAAGVVLIFEEQEFDALDCRPAEGDRFDLTVESDGPTGMGPFGPIFVGRPVAIENLRRG